jgi:hypothetical protein
MAVTPHVVAAVVRRSRDVEVVASGGGRITAEAGEELGLSITGRGFDAPLSDKNAGRWAASPAVHPLSLSRRDSG